MEQREAEELARTLEMWAALGGSESDGAAAGMTMLQAAAALRAQATLIASLRATMDNETRTTCC